MSLKNHIKVALTGNPNSGKTTLFNTLTGLNQKTGNFPGVTVDKKSGLVKIKNQTDDAYTTLEFIDLPGIYSLQPRSLDEEISCKILQDKTSPDFPDVVLAVIDIASLKRSLFFVTQLIDLRLPLIVVLNNTNGKEKIKIDSTRLSSELGVKVVEVNALSGKGSAEIKKMLLQEVTPSIVKIVVDGEQTDDAIGRYKFIDTILKKCSYNESTAIGGITEKLDKILLHKVWGYVVFLFALLLIFQSVFFLASYPMSWIESFFIYISEYLSNALPPGKLTSLIIDGVLAGLSGIAIFIPQIALLFGLISIMEETGYMARVSYIMDRMMRKFGLNGRSVIPLVSGVACAVPAIMSTRTISNWKERLITIMITPLISCSARLPVYTLLIALVVPSGKLFGIIGYQGFTLLLLYIIGFVAAIIVAWIMKKIIKTKEKSYFVLEIPQYRFPKTTTVLYAMYEKVKVFLFDAGKIIIAISIILWGLSSFAPGNRFQEIEMKYTQQLNSGIITSVQMNNLIASEKLEASYAGIVGKAIAPAIAPLGFDWKIGIALVTSFAAREVFVGTMATMYSVGGDDAQTSVREKMMNDMDAGTGKKKYTFALGLSLMVFYAFAMQCMSTIAVVYRETKGWRWPLIQLAYMSALAYISSYAVYNLFG